MLSLTGPGNSARTGSDARQCPGSADDVSRTPAPRRNTPQRREDLPLACSGGGGDNAVVGQAEKKGRSFRCDPGRLAQDS